MKNFDHRLFAQRANRGGIGFDRILDILDAISNDAGGSFPPYDIERVGEDGFRLTLALAGYGEEEVSVETAEGVLTVTGTKPEETEARDYLHRGIANRSFERKFRLADHVEVKSAEFRNGLLSIGLQREIPEAKKPRKIEIVKAGGAAAQADEAAPA